MTISLEIDGERIHLKTMQFPGGEINVDIVEDNISGSHAKIVSRIQDPQDLMELLLLSEILDRSVIGFKHLLLPYFPYARQDRITHPGGTFSLKVMSELINALRFNSVTILDPHSDVTPALIDNCITVKQVNLIKRNIPLSKFIDEEVTALVAPDVGAYKKTQAVADFFHIPVFTGLKKRDTATGTITGTEVLGEVCDANLLIVDDICDGGRTFTELAKELKAKGAKSVSLYVTHGIFSRGYGCFEGLIDRIYTTDSFLPKVYPAPGQVPLFIFPIVD